MYDVYSCVMDNFAKKQALVQNHTFLGIFSVRFNFPFL